MATLAQQYLEDLRQARIQNPQRGPERDEAITEVIDHYHRKAVKRRDGPDTSIQWYSDGSATSITNESPETQVWNPIRTHRIPIINPYTHQTQLTPR